ncbi:hypothetical protein QR680_019357 [Steinernema hermaphroditum]|uniref:MD-2-related lipid-recognition domain-containing protein n=1 Tax=Steinernema hermaphroditum TaxID=289476 RepID=A0AA39GQX9_9BILA|nr:hypothetical protein QR680_019357 [Steinernema hermaphroditum]
MVRRFLHNIRIARVYGTYTVNPFSAKDAQRVVDVGIFEKSKVYGRCVEETNLLRHLEHLREKSPHFIKVRNEIVKFVYEVDRAVDSVKFNVRVDTDGFEPFTAYLQYLTVFSIAHGMDLNRPFLDQVTRDCSMSPNGTYAKPHFFSCPSFGGNKPILFLNEAAVTNSSGDETFPIDFRQTVRFFFDVTNLKNKKRFDNLEVEIALYKRYSGWLGCGWIFVPTFGLLNNLDLCKDNLSCPIRPGRQVVEVPLEPSPMLRQVLRMVHDATIPYQISIRIRNRRNPKTELLCVNYQTRIII